MGEDKYSENPEREYAFIFMLANESWGSTPISASKVYSLWPDDEMKECVEIYLLSYYRTLFLDISHKIKKKNSLNGYKGKKKMLVEV